MDDVRAVSEANPRDNFGWLTSRVRFSIQPFEGSRFVRGNDFTCMPGNPKVVGEPPMCVDAASLQWFADAKAHKPKPTNTVAGITYMLAGATQRSDSDPNDMTSMPIEVGPYWMIMWPFDPKATGLPVTHKDTGAYIMWAGSPYAHMHIMGRP